MKSENQIKAEIKEYLDKSGWFNFPISQQGYRVKPGISDRIAVKNGIVLFIEVKTESGKLSESQKSFRESIVEKGGHYIVARSVSQLALYLKIFLGRGK